MKNLESYFKSSNYTSIILKSIKFWIDYKLTLNLFVFRFRILQSIIYKSQPVILPSLLSISCMHDFVITVHW